MRWWKACSPRRLRMASTRRGVAVSPIAQLKDVDRSVALLLLDGFSYKEIASSSALARATSA